MTNIYVVCTTDEGILRSVNIRGVFLDQSEAIQNCPVSWVVPSGDGDGEAGWVWEFQPGQSWEEARIVFNGLMRTTWDHVRGAVWDRAKPIK